EAGAAGVAMMAAVAIGAYSNMDDCIAEWVTPLLGDAEAPDADQARRYDRLFSAYVQVRQAIAPAWDTLVAP
ncbi:carbohydrate kinase, partial [Agrobacterium sp. BETTINA12B]|nr:carbohydrate kinase [Agrobacterium sp. BETTINA12B]